MICLRIEDFSEKQMKVLTWWQDERNAHKLAIICDGAVRSGKTFSMGLSFVLWAMATYDNTSFAICGKTIHSVRRNMTNSLCAELRKLNMQVKEKISENLITIKKGNVQNRFYLFGGKDSASASYIQGITLGGILFDEAALMPRDFIEQGIARCSVTGSRLWFNCNPEHPEHWFYKEWILRCEERNALYIHFTMDDNPALSEEIKARYCSMFEGSFYERYVEGKWSVADGLIYSFMRSMICEVPHCEFSEYAASCDYGTVNPTSIGLWGKSEGVWYRIDEYYYDARKEKHRKTDDEHYAALVELCAGRELSRIVVDPSAASFITLLRRTGMTVVPAKNDVVNGIRETAAALKQGKIKICRCCVDSAREFGLYRWKDGADEPRKEYDHAMDDIRYFVTSILSERVDEVFAVSVRR